ncbi:hypothetical protein OQ252_08985 [Acetobacter farinalis]|uniref:Uncharacterized protein n=1 Tax=Acetobacter farinalis TaxID=1260984 RepID=A0ABT3Q8D5_9PROT|nr:hypothetical protein [Acetobacter farinalis]MCX2561527.1 hypothetical protein [Acetobacter farinalis]NHO30406.1 hypothetical protein [Acetobacter farinalis]
MKVISAFNLYYFYEGYGLVSAGWKTGMAQLFGGACRQTEVCLASETGRDYTPDECPYKGGIALPEGAVFRKPAKPG